MTVNLGEVIASRSFQLEGSPNIELIVLIGTPQQFPDSGDFYVPYQIRGFEDEETRYVGGVDSVQCLQLVMKVIGAKLARLNALSGHAISWEGDNAGGLGFPL